MSVLDLQPGDCGHLIVALQAHIERMQSMPNETFNTVLHLMSKIVAAANVAPPASSKADYVNQLQNLLKRIEQAAVKR